MARLVLASASPRRRELMNLWGVTYRIAPADLDEDRATAELGSFDPSAIAQHLARAKALAVSAEDDEYVIGVDTLVALGDQILGKPVDEADAFAMLHAEQGNAQTVHSGLAVVHRGEVVGDGVEQTIVRMRPVPDEVIWQYIRTEKPFDKAGAYAIQEGAGSFIEGYEGCYNNIVGLPLCLLSAIIKRNYLPLVIPPSLPPRC
ncbi:septum formation protein Maf [Candidatus Wirthbacteria bacterium CG2_30_54_11]|uniref:dTTP/UTP pyrophosphatase n=1 Tax=Candidatus Wirthbacteria bacterium CG2_30_54_11 TaxID=1817892 RepID=A0A1J5IZD8_9BACT|nr:MAG: septum formation protein Maf [Candidatus Wirthbacteria bacterium CG2_30_54_11]